MRISVILGLLFWGLSMGAAAAQETGASIERHEAYNVPAHLRVHVTKDRLTHSTQRSVPDLLSVMQLHQLEAIAATNAEIAQGVTSMKPLADNIGALAEEIRRMNEAQLIAIQRAVVTRLDTLPLQMVDDPAVAAEIRRLAVEAVETEFDVTRRE